LGAGNFGQVASRLETHALRQQLPHMCIHHYGCPEQAAVSLKGQSSAAGRSRGLLSIGGEKQRVIALLYLYLGSKVCVCV